MERELQPLHELTVQSGYLDSGKFSIEVVVKNLEIDFMGAVCRVGNLCDGNDVL